MKYQSVNFGALWILYQIGKVNHGGFPYTASKELEVLQRDAWNKHVSTAETLLQEKRNRERERRKQKKMTYRSEIKNQLLKKKVPGK